MLDDRKLAIAVPAGTGRRRPTTRCRSPRRAPAGATAGCGVLDLPPGGRTRSTPARTSVMVLPLSGVVPRDRATASASPWPAGEACSPASPTSPTCPATPARPSPSEAGGRFALPSPGRHAAPRPRTARAEGVPVELRGAGQASRQVNNFCTAGDLRGRPADRGGGAHPGRQLVLLPAAQARRGRPGRVRARGDLLLRGRRRPGRHRAGLPAGLRLGAGPGIDVCAEVRTGDTVLVPYGWHGPSMAAPGYDLYYLNVMAGPGRAGLADLRRPGSRLGPRHLGRPADRPAAAVLRRPRYHSCETSRGGHR